jgi:hypothetical protein
LSFYPSPTSNTPKANITIMESVQVTSRNAADIKAAASQQQASERGPATPIVNDAAGKHFSITYRGDKASFSESSSHASSADADVAVQNERAGKPVLGKSSAGRPLTGSELSRDSVVDLPGGMTTSLAAAIASGFVVQNEAGQYVYAGGSGKLPFEQGAPTNNSNRAPEVKPESKTAEEAPGAVPQIERMSDEAEAAMSEVIAKVPEAQALSLSRELIETGALSQEGLNIAAQKLGITPEEASARATQLHSAFHEQASRAVGPASDEVFSWARANAPNELRRAITEQVNNGTTKGYAALNAKFVENLDTLHPQLLLESTATKALNVRKESDGKITVELPKLGRVSWRVAVRSGLLGNVRFNSNPFRKN